MGMVGDPLLSFSQEVKILWLVSGFHFFDLQLTYGFLGKEAASGRKIILRKYVKWNNIAKKIIIIRRFYYNIF